MNVAQLDTEYRVGPKLEMNVAQRYRVGLYLLMNTTQLDTKYRVGLLLCVNVVAPLFESNSILGIEL